MWALVVFCCVSVWFNAFVCSGPCVHSRVCLCVHVSVHACFHVSRCVLLHLCVLGHVYMCMCVCPGVSLAVWMFVRESSVHVGLCVCFRASWVRVCGCVSRVCLYVRSVYVSVSVSVFLHAVITCAPPVYLNVGPCGVLLCLGVF